MTKKSIYLDYASNSNEILLSQEGYDKVLEILKAYRICSKCECFFTDDNMNVAANLCLHCFQKDHNTYEFVGPHEKQGYKAFLFLDKEGRCQYTIAGSGSDDKPREDLETTMKYWNFPIPQTSMDKENFKLSRNSWHLYGNVRTDKVLIARYWDSYETIDIAFFIVRDTDKVIRFNKHLKDHRTAWNDAVIEHKKRRPDSQIWESWIYEIILEPLNEIANSGFRAETITVA